MRSLLLVVVAAGCGFSATDDPGGGGGGGGGGNGTGVDAPRLDAAIDAAGNPMIDAAIDAPIVLPDAAIDAAPLTWTVVDTLTVGCRGVGVTSTFVLVTGVTYRLRASGECIANTANNSRQDADFLGYNVGPTYDEFGQVDNGIAINDPNTQAADKQPTWGPYNATTHTYEVPWVGANAAITATFHETILTNNTGSLTLGILALQ